MQYYAITKYDRTKSDPFAVIRINQGIIEIYNKSKGKWEVTSAYNGIINGNFSDYEIITEEEAAKLVEVIPDDH